MGVPKNESERIATGASLLGISEEGMAVHRAAVRRWMEQDEKELLVRRKRAWGTVRRAAKFLKEVRAACQRLNV